MLIERLLKIERKLKVYVPSALIDILRPIRNRVLNKGTVELSYWRSRLEVDQGVFSNSYFKVRMLAMAEESTEDFVNSKFIADFGCGPRGSLVWAQSAALRIGIDVLADSYADAFKDNIVSHGMVYLVSPEQLSTI